MSSTVAKANASPGPQPSWMTLLNGYSAKIFNAAGFEIIGYSDSERATLLDDLRRTYEGSSSFKKMVDDYLGAEKKSI